MLHAAMQLLKGMTIFAVNVPPLQGCEPRLLSSWLPAHPYGWLTGSAECTALTVGCPMPQLTHCMSRNHHPSAPLHLEHTAPAAHAYCEKNHGAAKA